MRSRWVRIATPVLLAGIAVGVLFVRHAVRAAESERLLLLGLDGATFTILDREIAAGHLPAFRRMIEEGVRARLEAEVAYSPPSWTTIATGVSRRTHGIDDFLVDDPSVEGGRRPTDRLDSRVVPFWDLLARNGVRHEVVGWLFTRPGRETETGIVDPVHDLQSEGLSPGGYLELFRRKTQAFAAHEREVHPRCAALVLFGPDKLQHDGEKWEAMERDWGREPHDSEILRYYHEVDRWLGARIEEDPGRTVLLVSDHGFQGWDPAREVSLTRDPILLELNAVLYDLGMLHLREGAAWRPSPRLARRILDGEIDRARTVATGVQHFLQNGAGIRLNLRGRDPGGIVAPERARGLLDRIRDRLLAIQDREGWAPFHEARRELDPGPHEADLVLEGSPFPLADAERVLARRVSLGERSVPLTRYARALRKSSFHAPDGIFLLRGPMIRRGLSLSPRRNLDVAPTILYLLGCAIPRAMEGAPALAAFRPGFTRSRALADGFGLRPLEGSIDITRHETRPREGGPSEDAGRIEDVGRIEEEMRRLGYIR